MNATLETRYLAVKQRLFRTVYEATLNPPQARAVFQTEGPLLVLAGAGSGKTTVLVRRIAFIIRYGNAYHSTKVPGSMDEAAVLALEHALTTYTPQQIEEEILPAFIEKPCPPYGVLAITFTNKAAKEIKERLAKELGDEAISSQITAGTFHAVCVRILHRFGERVGHPAGFTIYDQDDAKRLVADCMKELNIDDKILPPKTVANAISASKDKLISPGEYTPNPRNPRDKDIARVYTRYQEKLLAFNALDFDDIIMKTVKLLEENEDVRKFYQSKFRYVSVDEYQDTNPAQFRLTELLSGGFGNLMVVGDDDQSIYRFRGATVENILSFDKVYGDATTVIKLEQNYRSTKHILDAANAVISHNSTRHDKTLWCAKEAGEPIHLRRCLDQNDEARYIVDTVTDQVVMHGRKYGDFAILYRVNEQARALESAFAKSGIPYRVLGSQRFYDRKEIRDMAAYLHVILNPGDNQRLKRIINEPKRGIGDTSVGAVEAIAMAENTTMFRVMQEANRYVALSRIAPKLIEFADMIRSFQTADLSPSQLMEQVFERTGYHQMLVAEGEVSKTRIDAVEEFVSAAKEYEARQGEDAPPSLLGFMEEVALVSDTDKYDDAANAVVLMTVHSAKGLEFPVVFLPGMEENLFPGSRSMESPEEMSEERRLAYVAITRAKEALYMTHTQDRMMYGRTSCNPLSRFVANEIPKSLIQEEAPPRRFAPPMGNLGASPYPQRGYMSYPQKSATAKEMAGQFGWRSDTVASQKAAPKTAKSFGVDKFPVGTRVLHSVFGEGTVLDARDMGGDILYQVAFDNGETKKLMATFAKLKKL